MKRLAVIASLVLGATLWWMPPPAGAGGWAITSLDEAPSPVAGRPLEVGFTILQHGVTPARVSGDVGIDITPVDGPAVFAPARAVGADGHYVATVQIDIAGSSTWSVRQGWFQPHPLGEVVTAPAPVTAVALVADATPPTVTRSVPRWPAATRSALAAAAAAIAVAAVLDGRAQRRSRLARP